MKGSSQIKNFPPLPDGFLERMRGLLGPEYSIFSESLHQPSVSGLRVNPSKVTAEEMLALLPFEVVPVPWCSTGFQLKPSAGKAGDFSPGKYPYHASGLYYLHEPSAMVAVEIMDPQPGERVLDLAAAPGGKATHIISKMRNTGLLVANDIHPKRAWELAENLERWGARNTVILNETSARLADRFSQHFDRVLLDAPCSGEGMFRKSDNARREWSPELVHSCAARQAAILEQAAKMVVPGGTIVYSTCTFAPEENEGVIAGFLQEHPEFEVAPPNPQPGFSSGRPDWAGKISSKIADQIENTVRLWPHQAPGDGHFIARLNHNGSPSGISHHPRAAGKLPLGYRQAFNEFFSAALEYDLGIARLLVKGAYLYHIPEQLPDLSGLHVIHTGLWLGVFKGGTNSPTIRFEPAHALALAIKSEQARHVSELNFKQAVSYLRGEVLSYPGEDGWVLATFDRFPLGWGKRSKGRLNNYYPKGLRWV